MPRPASPRSTRSWRLLEARARASRRAAIPAGFTYLGQFIDHDITFDPTPFGAAPRRPAALVNLRTPRLDLDSLYGGGPDAAALPLRPRRARAAAARPRAPPLDLPRNDAGGRADRRPAQRRERDRLAAAPAVRALPQPRSPDERRQLREGAPARPAPLPLDRARRVPAGGPRRPRSTGPREHFTFDGRAVHPGRVLRRGVPLRPLDGAPRLRDQAAPGGRGRVGPGACRCSPTSRASGALEPEREIAWERFFELVDARPAGRLGDRHAARPDAVRAARRGRAGAGAADAAARDQARAALGPGPRRRRSACAALDESRPAAGRRATSPRGRRSPLHAALVLDPLRGGEGRGPAPRAARAR